MNKEIYDKLIYQIEEKDRKRKEAKKEFFQSIDKSTEKLYYKIWSEILKSYKKSGLDTISFSLSLKLEECIVDKYNIKLYKPLRLNKKSLDEKLISLEKLRLYLRNDGIDCEFFYEDNLIINININEDLLRSIEQSSRAMYPSKKVLTRSAKSTKVKGK